MFIHKKIIYLQKYIINFNYKTVNLKRLNNKDVFGRRVYKIRKLNYVSANLFHFINT